MITEKETLKCEAIFNEDHTHRYFWKRVWNKDKPTACVIMLNPCMADTIITDTTTYLVVNNVASLEKYGAVEIVNLYSKLTSKLNLRWDSDDELNGSDNDTYIKKAAAECDIVILAWGTGATENKRVNKRIKYVLDELKQFKNKMFVITDGEEKRLIHPLSPSIRNQWVLSPYQHEDSEISPKGSKLGKTKTDVREEITQEPGNENDGYTEEVFTDESNTQDIQ